MTREPFTPAHFDEIELQPWQAYLREYATESYLRTLQQAGPCYVLRHQGRIVICCGLIEMPGCAHMWAFLSVDAKRHLLTLTRYAKRFMQSFGRPCYTATIEVGFRQGQKWLRMLGFVPDPDGDILPGFGPDGRDHQLFVRGAL